MGSPFGPALANVFVGYYEEKLFLETRKPPVYFRDADNTTATFNNEAEPEKFLTTFNCLHTSLKFTFEKNKCLLFLSVDVEKKHIGFETSAYQNTPSLAIIICLISNTYIST